MNIGHRQFVLAWASVMVLLLPKTVYPQDDTGTGAIHLADNGKQIVIEVGDELFTRYDYRSYKKPVFYPVFGPNQIPMTRNYPMEKVSGEATDHPHHKSMWIGHEINGIDFWTEKGGSVKTTKLELDDRKHSFSAHHDWICDATGETIVSDQVNVGFLADSSKRIIDYVITFAANSGDVTTFNDTKEGFFALRVHPQLRSSKDVEHGVDHVTGVMTNANGETGPGIWGKRARWVDYSGTIDGQKCGIAIFDHPGNLRHPTWWHARDYGLFAANPFGKHYFEKAETGAGEFVLKKGESQTFRYRVIFHLGDTGDIDLDREFKDFSSK